MDDKELVECTFQPQLKWDLVTERRERAREEAERAEIEARSATKPKKSVGNKKKPSFNNYAI